MQDIANRLHVSRSTVSLVLSGKAGSKVSDAVKKEVIRTAKEMNYHVNSLARSLRTGESKVISVIVTDISNEFFGHLTFHIQEEAKKAGYLVMTINSNESTDEFDDAVIAMMGKKVDGFIVVPTPGGSDSVGRILEQGVPIVTVDRLCEGLNVDYVGVDNYDSARQAVEGLIADGYRRIAMVGLDLDITPLNERLAAYEDALDQAGLGDSKNIIKLRFGDSEDASIDSALPLLKDADAVFFTSRRAFTHTMTRAGIQGVSLGRDICLLCYDEIGAYISLSDNIRYVEQPIEEMARKAFELLIAQIKGNRSMGRYIFSTTCIQGKKTIR